MMHQWLKLYRESVTHEVISHCSARDAPMSLVYRA